jgi:site-specific recombinase XerD
MKDTKFYNQLERYLFDNFTDQTAKSYFHLIKRFLRQYPNADYLSLSDIETYFLQLKSQGKKVNYRNVILSAIKVYYDFIFYKELIKHHPCKSYYITEKKPSGLNFNELLTIDEMELLFKLKQNRYKNLLNRDKVIIGLLIYQGVTSQELTNIKLHHIENGTVFIKGDRNRLSRTIELKSVQMEPMLKYIEFDRPKILKVKTNKLILTLRGVPTTVDSIHAMINSLSGAFEKEISPANIRKSVISYWINQRGFKLEDVQIMAGHKYPSSTQKYIKVNTDKQREVMTRLHENIFK